MIEVQNFMPESDFKVDDNITLDELKRKWQSNTTIVVSPRTYNIKKGYVRVYLGNNIYGCLPFSEVSLEDIKDEIVPVQVRAIMRKQSIRVKITKIEGKEILLSRKSNLEEVFNQISNIEKGIYYAMVERVDKHCVFFDIAEGICAYCEIKQLSRVFIKDARDWISVGRHMRVRVTQISESEHRVWCSAKKAAFGDYKKIKAGTKIVAKVGDEIRDTDGHITGFYVEITPAISGIADIRDNITTEYPKFGDIVWCYVRSVNPKERHIKLYID